MPARSRLSKVERVAARSCDPLDPRTVAVVGSSSSVVERRYQGDARMNIEEIQKELRDESLDGWLFCDFHNRDHLAYRILGLPNKHTTRRWFYYVPAKRTPIRLVHSVEPTKLDSLPGHKVVYQSWAELQQALKDILGDSRRVAMQYSPRNQIPQVSLVDAGTVELVRHCGVEVVSSADLVQRFEALVSAEGFATHEEAGRRVHKILKETWEDLKARLGRGEKVTEYDVQSFIRRRFRLEGLDNSGDGPIVAVRGHAADPHFEPTPEKAVPIQQGDTLLIDLWARLDQPGAIYYDITWCAFVGDEPPAEYVRLFRIACEARDEAVALVRERFAQGEPLHGWEVDEACRAHIEAAGLGAYFVHRTGHSIGEECHGNGVNLDSLETKDDRRIVPGCLFSVEPGIYVPDRDMGVRTEIDVYIDAEGQAVISGPIQQQVVLLS